MCATTLSIFSLVTWPYVALSTVLPFQKYVSVALPSCPCTLNARVGLAVLILYVNLVPSFIPSTGKKFSLLFNCEKTFYIFYARKENNVHIKSNNLHNTPLLNRPKCVAQLQRKSSCRYLGPHTKGLSA